MSSTMRVELVGLPDTDDEELRQLGAGLRRALLDLDVDDVQSARPAVEAELGAKGTGLISGALVVTAVPIVLRQVVQLTDSWLKNRPVRGVRIELDGRTIELGNASASEREKLIDAFLAHCEQPDGEQAGPEELPGPAQ
ncbi:hypothetical protein [Kitasatospora sp. NPDC059817]|uniref:hypothetical protein n=1 Tax=Kitasatospora sp. NPDC059817 TaxID=3346961 RepID=UPI0036482C8C